jgi:Na+-driven multidrug efflux pump
VTSYLRIYLIGAGTLFLSVTFERFLQAHGLMRECMLVQITGVVVNLALDPLLIFVVDLGLVGAGLGTVLGQVASGALALG